jgi:Tol biopolymer transport system component
MTTLRAFLLLLLATSAAAQSPAAEWRTIETAHFRVHYPREYEEWAMRAAERLESVREAVSAEVGFTPTQTIDVLVANPVAEPNGQAWPFLDTPRMIFWTEAPGPDEVIGAYGHWIDLLAVHEVAHVVHMLRPSRNPYGQLLEKFVLPLNPITLRAPRWVLEGYATVIEGRLTGAGRPTSAIRALVLRQWAVNGRLPSYGQLNSDRRFLGMSMAYLMGSAYLEWLEQRGGPDSLRNLWLRMTARERRSFSDAFTGVFGERPERLYGQFIAELTASAMTVDRSLSKREGALFQETPRASGDPAVSPDATQLAVVIRQRDVPEKLVIWSTAPPDEEERKYQERLDKIFARDPEDVRPVRTKPLPRKELHSLTMPDGGDIEAPRWTRDGKAIIFSHRVADADGFLHYDLYRWDFGVGVGLQASGTSRASAQTPDARRPYGERVTRITHLADVREADPMPDGRTAIALRSRHGKSQLVNVDLTTGEVTPRTEASIDVVESHPRVSPDGTRVAHIAHRGGKWALMVDDRVLPLPGSAASPEWLSNDELIFTLFANGFAELHRMRVDGEAEPQQLTSSSGGAFDPAPTPRAKDGRTFYMSLEPDGYVVRVIEELYLDSIYVAPLPADAALVPAIPPAPRAPAAFAAQPVTSRPYGLGRQEFGWFTAQNFGPDQRTLELGVRFGDVVGKLDTLLIGAVGRNDSPHGVALASAWRGWPVEVLAHAFSTNDLDGLELRGLWTRHFAQSRLTIEGGALSDDLLFASAAFSTRQTLGRSRINESFRLDVDDDHYRAVAAASFQSGSLRVGARYQHDDGTRLTLGGLPSSILPRSAYAHRVLDPAIPVAILEGDDYDGWRIESTVPLLPFTAFYQRHEIGGASLSLAGLEVELSADPLPIVKTPGLDLTAGVAYLFDAPLKGDTKWWLGMRWRP